MVADRVPWLQICPVLIDLDHRPAGGFGNLPELALLVVRVLIAGRNPKVDRGAFRLHGPPSPDPITGRLTSTVWIRRSGVSEILILSRVAIAEPRGVFRTGPSTRRTHWCRKFSAVGVRRISSPSDLPVTDRADQGRDRKTAKPQRIRGHWVARSAS
jgi:hypothetical protein